MSKAPAATDDGDEPTRENELAPSNESEPPVATPKSEQVAEPELQ